MDAVFSILILLCFALNSRAIGQDHGTPPSDSPPRFKNNFQSRSVIPQKLREEFTGKLPLSATLAEALVILKDYSQLLSESEKAVCDALMEQIVGFKDFSRLSQREKVQIFILLGLKPYWEKNLIPSDALAKTIVENFPAKKYLEADKARPAGTQQNPLLALIYHSYGEKDVPILLPDSAPALRQLKGSEEGKTLTAFVEAQLSALRVPQAEADGLDQWAAKRSLTPEQKQAMKERFARFKAAGHYSLNNNEWWKAAAELKRDLPFDAFTDEWEKLLLPAEETEMLMAFIPAARRDLATNLKEAIRLRKRIDSAEVLRKQLVTDKAIAIHADLPFVKIIADNFHVSPIEIAEQLTDLQTLEKELLALATDYKEHLSAQKKIAGLWEELFADLIAPISTPSLQRVWKNLLADKDANPGLKLVLQNSISEILAHRTHPTYVGNSAPGWAGMTSQGLIAKAKAASQRESDLKARVAECVSVENGSITFPRTKSFPAPSRREETKYVARWLAEGDYDSAVRLYKYSHFELGNSFEQVRASLLRKHSAERVVLPSLTVRGLFVEDIQ